MPARRVGLHGRVLTQGTSKPNSKLLTSLLCVSGPSTELPARALCGVLVHTKQACTAWLAIVRTVTVSRSKNRIELDHCARNADVIALCPVTRPRGTSDVTAAET